MTEWQAVFRGSPEAYPLFKRVAVAMGWQPVEAQARTVGLHRPDEAGLGQSEAVGCDHAWEPLLRISTDRAHPHSIAIGMGVEQYLEGCGKCGVTRYWKVT